MMDAFIERRPQPTPSPQRLKQCKLVAHRGEYRHGPEEENTIAAFDNAARAGVWGVELDIRWTKDLVPVVIHDGDMLRLYGDACRIDQISLAELKDRFPATPTLEEVVHRFGKQQHLMIELKEHSWIDLSRQEASLCKALCPLDPDMDYHLLALSPRILTPLTQIPPRVKVPIGYYLPDGCSQWVSRNQWGGLCGNYFTMRRAIVARHQRLGQRVGTGFVNSPNTLLRELNRGVDWIFSDNAARLQAFVKECLAACASNTRSAS